ncbi:MAG: hypothetical protein L0210_11345 [Rhodospirillales bacterium]|nr:hypothetical protein [Rhodospirillales bacterium]
MPMILEKRRQFECLLWRERIGWVLQVAPPFVIGGGLVVGLIWLRAHGSPAWIGLVLAGAAALAKPALMMLRVLEKRRSRNRLD